MTGCRSDQELSPGGAADALADYFEALDNGDQDACDLETEGYADQANERFAEFTADGEVPSCSERVKQTKDLLAAFEVELADAAFKGSEGSSDDEAVVDVTYPDDTEETYALVYDDGEWLVDDELGEAGELEEGSEESELSDEEATATGEAWIASWCEGQIGQTRDDAIEIMGEPTAEFTAADDATPQVNWELGPYSFTAFLDTDEVVNSFYANYDNLGASDLAQPPCVEEDENGTLERTDD